MCKHTRERSLVESKENKKKKEEEDKFKKENFSLFLFYVDEGGVKSEHLKSILYWSIKKSS